MSRYAEAWEMDTNPMRQGMMNPIAVLGEIPSKAFPDESLVNDFMANADDPALASKCYPNGNKPICHDLMPGDLLFALKAVRNPEMVSGEPNEFVFSSVAGMYWGDHRDEDHLAMDYYFVGICKTEYRYSSPNDNGVTKDPKHGVAILKVGTHSTANNGPYLLYPGMRIRWRMPVCGISSDQPAEGSIAHRTGETLNRIARGGTPNLQFRPEIVPFDYTDVTVNYVAAFNAMSTYSTNRGIADIPFHQLFERDIAKNTTSISPKQEAASGHWFGTAGVLAGALEQLLAYDVITIDSSKINDAVKKRAVAGNLVEKKHVQQVQPLIELLGVFATRSEDRALFRNIYANIFFNDLQITSDPVAKNYGDGVSLVKKADAMRVNNSSDPEAKYARLRFAQSRFHGAHLMGDWFHNCSSIVGTVLNFTAPGDLTHVLWGHFVL